MADPIFRVTDLEGAEYLSGNPIITNTVWEEPTWDSEIITQVLYLTAGWNMISTYIDAVKGAEESVGTFASGRSIENLLSQIVDKLAIAKDGEGNVYYPEYNYNGIGDAINGEGYSIRVTEDCSISVEGFPITSENGEVLGTIIELEQGWNIMGVPIATTDNSYSYDIVSVLEPLSSAGILESCRNNSGMAYVPEWGWNGIGNILSGQGYLMKISEAFSLELTTGSLEVLTPL
tara:strand:- start:681 stop:1379 length:699 start_codon:yes stop_codon:yes gene_type:complete